MSISTNERWSPTWLIAFPMFILLGGMVAHGAASMVHGRLLQLGESRWAGYSELRIDRAPPLCEADEGELLQGDADDEDSACALFPELCDDTVARDREEQAVCTEERQRYEDRQRRHTPWLEAFRACETWLGRWTQRISVLTPHILVVLFFLGAMVATTRERHISLRLAQSVRDRRCSAIGQLAACTVLVLSWYSKWRIDAQSEVQLSAKHLSLIWLLGSIGLTVSVALTAWRTRRDEQIERGVGSSLLAVPLYVWMTLVSGFYFFLVEDHPAGLAIHLQKLTEHALLYVFVGLYLWSGMLLRRTRIAALCFDIIRPWRVPADLLAVLVVILAAFPTAYSGASGIFVLAVGATIFQELQRAGARRQLALAATAMSGSLGVVLSPCLLVVIASVLDNRVTTDQLFHWGGRVFLLTSLLFLFFVFATKRGPWRFTPQVDARRASLQALVRIIPYLAFALIAYSLYRFGLDTRIDEHSAAAILPIFLLLFLGWEAYGTCRIPSDQDTPRGRFSTTVLGATEESACHLGALLALMGMSVCLGGVVERSGVLESLPLVFSSQFTAMMFLVVALVIIGMLMDPYGAIILVSVSLANVAQQNGIEAAHFWLVVLVAFEFGYLSPPVALNHLLTRQVVGVRAAAETGEHERLRVSLWYAHERVLLPLAVLGVALLLVAFVPLLW